MSLSNFSKISVMLLQETRARILIPHVLSTNLQFVRHRRNKHFNPKFKQLRKLKVAKVDLPNFQEKDEDIPEEKRIAKLRERGLPPLRPWNEREHTITSTGGAFEPYVPPEGDGKVSSITAQGAKQNIQYLEKRTKTMMAIRTIRKYEEDFDTVKFCNSAQEIYINAHKALVNKDKNEVINYVTELAFPQMFHNAENKTIQWKFLKAIELPRIVHARCTDVITKQNVFAQLTMRFHSQQILAIYDRFGRLIQGSETDPKEILEYIVFEKHIANDYGVWRLHTKIIPEWMHTKTTSLRTFKKSVDTPQTQIEPDTTVIEASTTNEKSKQLTDKTSVNT